jgi:hypothetical protein
MAIDADASTEAIDTSASWDVAEEFDVGADITAVGTPYFGYFISIEFDDDILAFVPVGDMNITYTDLGGMWSHAPASVRDADLDGRPEIFGESARNAGTTPETGRVNYVRFRCTAPGTTSLHLLTSSEVADFYTSTIDYPDANFITTILQDAAITCSSAAASPTPTALPAVGGIADVPTLSGIQAAPLDDASTAGTGLRAERYTALGLAATGVIVMAIVAWYAKRRRLR